MQLRQSAAVEQRLDRPTLGRTKRLSPAGADEQGVNPRTSDQMPGDAQTALALNRFCQQEFGLEEKELEMVQKRLANVTVLFKSTEAQKADFHGEPAAKFVLHSLIFHPSGG
jgi:hypothetical protein